MGLFVLKRIFELADQIPAGIRNNIRHKVIEEENKPPGRITYSYVHKQQNLQE